MERAGAARSQPAPDREHSPIEQFAAEILPEVDPDRSGEDFPSPVIQRTPLEAVWPVETTRKSATRDSATREFPDSGQAVQREVQSSERSLVAVETVRGALGQVRPGQISDSSVELVPTRHPRPDFVLPGVEKSAQTSVSEPLRPVLPDAPGSESGQLIQPTPDVRPQPAPVIQRKGASEASSTPLSTAEIVPTAIGPLPADLWELIGQPVPRQENSAEPFVRAAQAETQAEQNPPGAKNRLGVETNLPITTQPVSLADALGLVQRDVDEETQAQGNSATSGLSVPTSAAENHAAAEPDIEQLTKRVYAEVRRRLHQEWERLRR
jgi:hypothetical protein